MQHLIAEFSHLDGSALLQPLIEKNLRQQVALVSSFGTESVVLLHMVASIEANTPVIFVQTGKLFDETEVYRLKLQSLFGLRDVRVVGPLASEITRNDPHGALYRSNADLCCHFRKTLPLQAALSGFSAWISGRKRYHGGERALLPTMEIVDGRLKIDPLAHFTRQDIEDYITAHDLPRHPLSEAGYGSVGCIPCTVRWDDPANPRAGRWAGQEKTECGIHWSVNGQPIQVPAPVPLSSNGC
jgi:phosphoadenosine phosphosulfate reductase